MATIYARMSEKVFFSIRPLAAFSLSWHPWELPYSHWLVEVSKAGPLLPGHRACTCRCGSQLDLDEQMNEQILAQTFQTHLWTDEHGAPGFFKTDSRDSIFAQLLWPGKLSVLMWCDLLDAVELLLCSSFSFLDKLLICLSIDTCSYFQINARIPSRHASHTACTRSLAT